MRIGARLVVSLLAPLVLLVLLFGYLDQRRSQGQLRTELVREGRGVTRVVQLAIEDALRDGQLQDVEELVEQITGYERIFGIRVFAPDQSLLYQSENLRDYPFIHFDALSDVLRDGRSVETHRMLGELPVVTFIAPLEGREGSLQGALQVIQLESFIGEDLRASRNAIAILTGILIIATTTTILLVTHYSVSRPIEGLVRSLREIGSAPTSAPAPVHRQDELGRLAIEFNRMRRRLESSRASLRGEVERRAQMESQLHEAQRLATVGRLAAGLAHEIGTPLNVIRGRAETLRAKLGASASGEAARRSLTIIVSQIDRIARIVRGLLDFARPREPHKVDTHVPATVRRVLDFLAPRLEENGVGLELDLPAGEPRIPADPDLLQQVFLNIADNALDAMPRGGTLRVRAGRAMAEPPSGAGGPQEVLSVSFEDTGEGIVPENLGRVFDPFFTTKAVGQGTGLGLSISYGIVREHGGWLDVQSEPGRGTILTVHLPCAGAAAPATPRKEIAPA